MNISTGNDAEQNHGYSAGAPNTAPGAGAVPAVHGQLSVQFREGLANYELMPNEERLAHRLCLETFDRGRVRGRVEMERWATRLGLRDSKGLRPDKVERLLKSLMDLGVVDVNAAQGTYELRPHARDWSRLRALRCADQAPGRTDDGQRDAGSTLDLGLIAERPVSEAVSELSREAAVKAAAAEGRTNMSGPGPDRDWPALFRCVTDAIHRGATEQEFAAQAAALGFSADKSAECWRAANGVRRINPPKGSKTEKNWGLETSAKSADASRAPASALASLALSEKAELAKAGATARSVTAAEKSAERAAQVEAAIHWLREVDERGHLSGRYGPQWRALCERDPAYVLNRLAGAIEDNRRRVQAGDPAVRPVQDPLAWLSRKARDDGRLR